ncbi:protein artemis isoform 2-T2 [Aplochiton taeniatus]
MSSFAGRMREYPTISLDRFDRENLNARAYFLSHCHKDHMKGLKGPLLKRKLKFSRLVKLYCSFVTKELLLSSPKYGFWEHHIDALELESPTQITLIDETSGERQDIVVTLLPAGHCPGSVMFLVEGAQGTVLYTGDFRLSEGDASRIELLHSGSRVKDIQSVYLDSTFYDPRFYQIPSREACLRGVQELVGDWISRSAYHVVWLNCKAAYGYEYLFTNLGKEFNTQIHVKNLDMFKKMPEILSYVTTKTSTQIHACRHQREEEYVRGNRLPCGSVAPDGTPLQIISIKPSTMWFGERNRKTKVIVKTGASSYRACFSFHSSYSEIKDFLSHLQPVNIYPSVIPICRTLTDVTDLLKPMCRKQHSEIPITYKPLGILKRSKVEQDPNDSDDWLFEGMDLAPMRKRKMVDLEVKPLSPCIEAAPTTTLQEPQPYLVLNSTTVDYMDCTESNDEGDEDDEEEEIEEDRKQDEMERKKEGEKSKDLPCWEEFFTPETLTDSQNSQTSESQNGELENSQNSQTSKSFSCSLTSPSNSAQTGSQTPELFGGGDVVENCGQGGDSEYDSSTLPDTLIIDRQDKEDIKNNGTSHTEEIDIHNLKSETGELSESQVSSDFDIPCTPESQTPRSDELNLLYKKLAAGEEFSVKGS